MNEDRAVAGSGGRAARWMLGAVLAVSLALRTWMCLVAPRYFDDHYVLNNIAGFLGGSLRPRHSYYGSLSYLPQALALALCDFLHSRTGIGALAVHGTYTEGFSLAGFRIARMFVCGYAVASLWMIYRVGRRLATPAVGLLAAAVLASYPQHLRSATQLKPDMLALLLTLAALDWTVRAARDPRLSRFLLAGAGVGLAISAKYTGIASALPLAAWGLSSGWRDRRRWGWLLLAALAAVATFFALNPFVTTVVRFVPKLVHWYAGRGRGLRSDHLQVLGLEVAALAREHGWLLGAFLLLGTAVLIARLWRPRESWERTAALLPLSLCLGYPVLHAALVTWFRNQNLLPAAAGTALVCASGLAWCGQRLAERRVPWRAPSGTATVLLAMVGLLLARQLHSAYGQAVPETWAVAQQTLQARLAPLGARQVAYELPDRRLRLAEGWRRSAETRVPSLAALSPAGLDLTDAELFPLAEIEGPRADFYLRRRQRLAGGGRLEIRPRPFRLRGTPLILLLHPWAPAGDPVPLQPERPAGSPRGLAARLPAGLAAGDVLSIEILCPDGEGPPGSLLLRPAEQSLPLHYAGHRRRQLRFLTARFRHPGGPAEVRIPAPARSDPRSYRLLLYRWTQEPSVAPRASPRSGGSPG